MGKNRWKQRFLPGKPLKMDEISKNDISYGPHMPGIDLNPVPENMEQFLKIDFVQPTPISIVATTRNRYLFPFLNRMGEQSV